MNSEESALGVTFHKAPESFGAWAFRNRSWLPVPLAVAVILLGRHLSPSPVGLFAGAAIIAAGQAVRFWAVRHIGTISRTRAARTGPLVTTGPYALVRNPLYVGNWCLWTGVVICSQVLWMLPVAWVVFMLQYGAIAAWEERLMLERYPNYREYLCTVPGWFPRLLSAGRAIGTAARPHPWSLVFFSERGTLMAIAVVAALLALRH